VRAHVRDLFLRGLGLVFLVAFISLGRQVSVLYGAKGLLPACEFVGATSWTSAPSLFRLACDDRVLHAGIWLGSFLSALLVLGIAPRACVAGLWALYASYVTVGQDFLSFQWDNLLLESGFFALFVAPGGLRLRGAPPPHPAGVFLMLWLLVRLHVESGLAKLLLGDPTWRDLTAMSTYYETAPLPTWLGWWAHQMPMWAHKACGAFTYVVELVLPLAAFGPRALRVPAFLGMAALQAIVIATANYGFFNYLSLLLCLWMLDDAHLARLGWRAEPAPERVPRPVVDTTHVAAAVLLVPLTVVPFLPFLHPPDALSRALIPVRRVLDTARTINAYHLFASMTLVRREVVIEGSDDGAAWRSYEFRWKPGDLRRAPAFVAPHQPRVDFQLWFLLLGHRHGERYFDTLLVRLLTEPAAVASLFADDPFPTTPPHELRVAFYRYRFTDRAGRTAAGAWWTREFEGYSRVLDREALAPRK